MTISEDVQSISFHNYRPLLAHLYVGPFVALYSVWAAVFLQGNYSLEVQLISLAVVAIFQVLCCLFCVWSMEWKVLAMCSTTRNPHNACLAKVKPTQNNGNTVLCSIHRLLVPGGDIRLWLEFQQTKYVCGKDNIFNPVAFPVDYKIEHYTDSKGLSTTDVETAENKWGMNMMDIVLPTFKELFIERATAPFFVFQVFCVGLWCLDEYWYYSLFTLGMLALFEATVVKQQMRSMSEIKKMTQEPFSVSVYRNKRWEKVKSNELYPGDLLSLVRSSETVPCDLLLIKGQCVVDESMLTGEAVPLMKEPLLSDSGGALYDGFLDLEQHSRLHVVFGGTKVIQHSGPTSKGGLRANDGGCIAYVLRTGFSTAQGKLLRTIIYSVQRVTANNFETFMFILFLLQFAIAASAYVWIKGTEDPTRNRYKLFLECTLIITSVVPPELPIELSLAVNSSLLSLIKMGIYCTEPFRIPFGGKVTICCFDKTGTLTTDKLELTGVVGVAGSTKLADISTAPQHTCQVLATCHSLIHVDDQLIGDPLEKAALTVLPWTLTRGDVAMCRTVKQSLKILKRFHFNSQLKRMSVIVSQQDSSYNIEYLVMSKGAPEVIKSMLKDVPEDYDVLHKEFSLQGGRVIALARRSLGPNVNVREVTREEAEQQFDFAGFVVFSAPLKKESKSAVLMLQHSSHHVVMITGDSPLTACFVATQLKIAKKLLVLTETKDDWHWESPDSSVSFPISSPDPEYSLCLTGQGLSHCLSVQETKKQNLFEVICAKVKVFARVTPKQKELVITTLKAQGHVCVMCGDGTNDVGALKHADVGVAILSNAPEVKPEDKKKPISQEKLAQKSLLMSQLEQAKLAKDPRQKMIERQKALENKLQELQLEEQTLVKLGDASIASPFTSKWSSVKCVCSIIRQGRCTLVTTLQMFKILALNALIIAYCQSALYLDGVKFSDGQATLQGLLLAGCFLFISRSKPLEKLSKSRPHANIFNIYTISTVLLQFAVHLYTIITLVGRAHELDPKEDRVDLDADFAPNLLNTVVYIMSVVLQLNTFIINYRGHPYMESLRDNKALCYSACTTIAVMITLTLGVFPQLCKDVSLILLPDEFKYEVLWTLFLDSIATFVIDRSLVWMCGDAKLKSID